MTGNPRLPGFATVLFSVAIAITLAAAVATLYLLMQPSAEEMLSIALLLTVTAAVSLVAGYAAHRLGWVARSPRLSLTLLAGYGLASVLTFVNVWVTARLMFVSQHDLIMATVLLVFAGGIAMSLGYYLSTSITDGLRKITQSASQIARGQFGTRVPIAGRDELADLGRSFNEMASQLEDAAQRHRELDTMRRDLIAWVGHDLRTPLASIRAMAEALADGVVHEPEKVERYLSTMEKDIRTLSALIDDLFEMAQVDAGGLELELASVSVEELIAGTVARFAGRANSEGVTVRGSNLDEVGEAVLDRQKMGRVMDNLVDNALRHTPRGGRVEISARRKEDRLELNITDTGSGIPEHDLAYIFDRFYRTEKSRSRATGGSGLGLAIAKGIVEAHGGQIKAESARGQGTAITVLLPLRARSQPDAEAPA